MDDIACQYLVEAGVMGLRRIDKNDLRKIAKSSGATILTTLATPEGEEVFDPSYLGHADEVEEKAVGDWDFVFFKGMTKSSCASIVIRGANDLMCDEVER
jgi:T-complex protein 1 subunit alpha